jgi:hypothetical protein
MKDQDNMLNILKMSPSVALLRSRNYDIIIAFFIKVFSNITVVSYENIHNQLTDFLNENGVEADEDEDVFFSDPYEVKSEKFIHHWTEKGFLTNYRNEDGEIYYELSSHSSKVIDWLSGLKREEYIGTESKFKSIITQLRELVEYTNEDREKRLQILEDKKLEIEQQIQRLQMGDDVKIFEEYEIVPRFQQVNKLAKELLSDFKDVDDNFKNIIKDIYQKQIDPTLNKGGILQYTFDALDELKSSSQGKSFYAFWEFLLSRDMQDELEQLINSLFRTLWDRDIASDDRFLQNMVSHLYESGRKVYQTNDKMADKLSHIIRENDAARTDAAKRIVQEIKNSLIEISKAKGKPDISLTVEDGLDINIPFERKITFEQSESTEYNQQPENCVLDFDSLNEISKVFTNVVIDRKVIEHNLREVLNNKGQTTIAEVVSLHPLNQGLPELFAYFSVLNHFSHKTINEDKQEAIIFDESQKKRIIIPEIIVSQ